MLAKVISAALVGLESVPVEVEIDIASQGLPNFFIVGLPDKAVEEARERVRSAIKNSSADFPAKRITVNLAPADLPKEGPHYDLPIALDILLASGQIPILEGGCMVLSELALDGSVRRISGTLSHTMLAREKHIKSIFIPRDNVKEASCIAGVTIFPVDNLGTILRHLTKQTMITAQPYEPIDIDNESTTFEYDMQDIKGQEKAKRALEIAAAGGHNMLMKGPPGSGKTLLARTLPSILPHSLFRKYWN